MQVIKRNGEIAEFDPDKIQQFLNLIQIKFTKLF